MPKTVRVIASPQTAATQHLRKVNLLGSATPGMGAWASTTEDSRTFETVQAVAGIGGTAVTGLGSVFVDGYTEGPTLGPNLITNGDFSSGTGWTIQGGSTIAGGILTLGSGPIARVVRTETVFAAGNYRLSVDLLTVSGSDVILVAAGGQTFQIPAASPAGTYAQDVTMDGSSGLVSLSGIAANPGVQLDNLSLKLYS